MIQERHPIVFPGPKIHAKQAYMALAAFSLLLAMIDLSWRRFVLAGFAFAFVIAADKIKDVEKAKRKERIETENRMKSEMNQGWSDSLGKRQQDLIDAVMNTAAPLLRSQSTYVRDASPTRTDRSIECNCNENEDDK